MGGWWTSKCMKLEDQNKKVKIQEARKSQLASDRQPWRMPLNVPVQGNRLMLWHFTVMKSWKTQPLHMAHTNDADSRTPGIADFGADFPLWLPGSFVGTHLFSIYMASQLSPYSHRRPLMSLSKSHCFSLTRIQVSEGQLSPNTNYTSCNIKAMVRVSIRQQETEDQQWG